MMYEIFGIWLNVYNIKKIYIVCESTNTGSIGDLSRPDKYNYRIKIDDEWVSNSFKKRGEAEDYMRKIALEINKCIK